MGNVSNESTTRGRELIQGAIDVHQHVGPDLWERSADAYDYATRASELGMGGFVLKNHCVETATWAYILSRAFPELLVRGSHVVNYASGGWNPFVVETSLRLGARIVYMPTIQSEHTIKRLGIATGPLGIAPYPVETPAGYPAGLTVFESDGTLRADVLTILELVRDFDAALGTGHLSPPEVMAIVAAAQDVGVQRIVLTHMSFPVIGNTSHENQRELARRGVFFEHSYQTTKHLPVIQQPTAVEDIVGDIRRVGLERSIFSSNFGQPQLPSPEVGFLEGIEALAQSELTDSEIRQLVVTNPLALLGE